MKTKIKPLLSIGQQVQIDYGKLTLLQLFKRIVNEDDTRARDELHNRYIFFDPLCKHGERLVERIARLGRSRLARRWCGSDQLVLDEAINLTLDKLFNIPTRQSNCQHSKMQGSDCRYYFRAVITFAERKLKAEPPANAIEAEITLAKALLGLIRWQFMLSCLEAKRRAQKLRRRYMWKVNGKILYIRIPWELPGNLCREWLEANILDVDPWRVGEQDRIQATVDKLLMKRKIYFLSELERAGEQLPQSPCFLSSIIRDRMSVQGLVELVATEKAENIKRQRTSIRRLGQERLKKLIHTIFARLADGQYVEKDIANSFNISSATMSRFAGSRWKQSCDDTFMPYVPDLWRNTAHMLADHVDFAKAAQKCGVWKRVRRILNTE